MTHDASMLMLRTSYLILDEYCLAILHATHLGDAPVDADGLPLLELGLAVLGRDALPVARRRQPRVHVSHHLNLQILRGTSWLGNLLKLH